MKSIWKYEFGIKHRQSFEIPGPGQIRHVGLDPNGQTCFWIEVDTSQPMELVEFQVIGTGHELPESGDHKGTVVSSPYVWHLYQIR